MGRPRPLSVVVAGLLLTGLLGGPVRAEVGRNGLIAFSRQADVFTIRSDGTGLRQLTSGDAIDTPLWSDDGRTLVVVRAVYIGGDPRWTVITMDPDGSNRKRLRPRVLGEILGAEISPDGTQLAYADVDLSNTGLPGPYASAIRTLDLRTGARSRLTGYATWNYGPSWSPDGTRIAFESSRDGDSEIFVMGADGSALTKIIDNEVNDFEPDWSPDGSRLVFASTLPPEPGRDESSGIAVVDSGGGDAVTLTEGPRFDNRPAWSPDGSLIAFSSFPATEGGGGSSLWVMNSDGTELRTLAEGDFGTWSPDGTRVGFARDGDLFSVPVAGGNTQTLTRGEAFDHSPAWQPR